MSGIKFVKMNDDENQAMYKNWMSYGQPKQDEHDDIDEQVVEKVVVSDDTDISYAKIDDSYVFSTDITAILFAICTESDDDIDKVTNVMSMINEHDVLGQFNKQSKDRDELKQRVAYFRSFSDRERRVLLSSAVQKQDNTELEYFKVHLRDCGYANVMFVPGQRALHLEDYIGEHIMKMILDPSYVISKIVSKKIEYQTSIANRIRKIVKGGSGGRESMKRDKAKVFLQNFSAWFLFGAGDVDFPGFKVESFKPLKELGAVGTSHQGVKTAFAEKSNNLCNLMFRGALPVYKGETVIEVSRCENEVSACPSLQVLMDDVESPYDSTVTPSIYCRSTTKEGHWTWRQVEEETHLKAKGEISLSRVQDTEQSIHLASKVTQYQREQAQKIKTDFLDENGVAPLDLSKPALMMPDEWREILGFDAYVSFHKRSISSVDEVEKYPDRIHFCKETSADELRQRIVHIHLFIVDAANFTIAAIPSSIYALSDTATTNFVVTDVAVSLPVVESFAGFKFASAALSSCLAGEQIIDWNGISSGDTGKAPQEVWRQFETRLDEAGKYSSFRKIFPSELEKSVIKNMMKGLYLMLIRNKGKVYVTALSSKKGKAHKKRIQVAQSFGVYDNPLGQTHVDTERLKFWGGGTQTAPDLYSSAFDDEKQKVRETDDDGDPDSDDGGGTLVNDDEI